MRTEEEAGDLLFAAVNVVRLCGVHAETALMAACEKFIRRFRAMEQAAGTIGNNAKQPKHWKRWMGCGKRQAPGKSKKKLDILDRLLEMVKT